MPTFADLLIEANYRPDLPDSTWPKVLRSLEVRPPTADEAEFTAQARELTSLTSGIRKVRVVALAAMPDLGLLDRYKGDTHLSLVAVDNQQYSRALRMTESNRRLRVSALQRRIERDRAALEELLGHDDTPGSGGH